MGVKGLHKESAKYYRTIKLGKLRQEVTAVAVDASYVAQRLIRLLDPSDTEGLYIYFYNFLLTMMMSEFVVPYVVFDGKAPAAKRLVIEDRHKRMEQNIQNRNKYDRMLTDSSISAPKRAEIADKIQKTENKIVRLSWEQIKNLKEMCEWLGVPTITSRGEADATCAYLCQAGYTDAVLSGDTDFIVWGCDLLQFGHFSNAQAGSIRNRNERVMVDWKLLRTKEFCAQLMQGTDVKHFPVLAVLMRCDYTWDAPRISMPVARFALSKVAAEQPTPDMFKLLEQVERLIMHELKMEIWIKIQQQFKYRVDWATAKCQTVLPQLQFMQTTKRLRLACKTFESLAGGQYDFPLLQDPEERQKIKEIRQMHTIFDTEILSHYSRYCDLLIILSNTLPIRGSLTVLDDTTGCKSFMEHIDRCYQEKAPYKTVEGEILYLEDVVSQVVGYISTVVDQYLATKQAQVTRYYSRHAKVYAEAVKTYEESLLEAFPGLLFPGICRETKIDIEGYVEFMGRILHYLIEPSNASPGDKAIISGTLEMVNTLYHEGIFDHTKDANARHINGSVVLQASLRRQQKANIAE